MSVLHGLVHVFQCLAVASLSGKGWIERPKAQKPIHDGTTCRTTKEQRRLAEELVQRARRIAREFYELGAQFKVEYEEWKITRRRSISVLSRMVRKLERLEEKTQGTDIAAGSFGFAGGCFTLTGLALAPFTGGVSALLATSGLCVEGLSCAFSISMLTLKLYGTKRYTRGAKELLAEDKERTERLAALCKALIASHEKLVKSAEKASEMIEDFGLNSQLHRFTIWPKERALDVVFNAGETVGGFPVVTIELLMKVGLLDHAAHGAEHVVAAVSTEATVVASEAATMAVVDVGVAAGAKGIATQAANAANKVGSIGKAGGAAAGTAGRIMVKEVGAETASVVGRSIVKETASETGHLAGRLMVKETAETASRGLAREAVGITTAETTAVVGRGAREAVGITTDVGVGATRGAVQMTEIATAETIGHASTAIVQPVYSAMQLLGGALTVCGMSLSLLCAVRASRKIRRGCKSEVGEIIEQIVEDLKENRDQFFQFHSDNPWLSETEILGPYARSQTMETWSPSSSSSTLTISTMACNSDCCSQLASKTIM